MSAHSTISGRPRVSPLEQNYGAFYDSTIAASDAVDAVDLMHDLNRICTIVAGLGEVLRIVRGNTVLADEYVEGDYDCPVPLSRITEDALTAMAAAVCDQIRDDIALRAGSYNAKVKA